MNEEPWISLLAHARANIYELHSCGTERFLKIEGDLFFAIPGSGLQVLPFLKVESSDQVLECDIDT